MTYVNQKDLAAIKKKLDAFDAVREQIINASRMIIKHAKHAIVCVHDHNLPEAAKLLQQAEKELAPLYTLCSDDLQSVGAYHGCVQEYVEAACFYHFVMQKKLLSFSSFKHLSEEDYLLGLCDLTGELARRAVLLVIAKKHTDVVQIHAFVQEIHDFFLELYLRNGELRKKYDSIKWNLKKIEEILYDLSVRKK